MNLNKIKLIPLPISGIILSLMGLGLFFKNTFSLISDVFITIGAVLIFLLISKIVLFTEESKKDLKSPIILGTFATLPMALMMVGFIAKDLNYNLGLLIWSFAILLHVILIIWFTKEHILKFKLDSVYTNYFVVFIGIGMASITGSAFKLQPIVDIIFLFSFISMILLLILVSYRYIKIPVSNQLLKPLICIYAAPFSLILCAFIQTSIGKPIQIIEALYILSVVFYIFSLFKAIKYILEVPFFPTFSAFTFPFVISATATKQIMNYMPINLEIFLLFQIIVAILFVGYVLIRYLQFIITTSQ